jgi:hypothetical protein
MWVINFPFVRNVVTYGFCRHNRALSQVIDKKAYIVSVTLNPSAPDWQRVCSSEV